MFLSEYCSDPEDARAIIWLMFVVKEGRVWRVCAVSSAEADAKAGGEVPAGACVAGASDSSAEGCAEWRSGRIAKDGDSRMRRRWTDDRDRLHVSAIAESDYSVGYPACTNLEDQEVVGTLLQPENETG